MESTLKALIHRSPHRKSPLGRAAHIVGLAKNDAGEIDRIAGDLKASQAVRAMIAKAAISAASTDDADYGGISGSGAGQAEFVEALAETSLFMRLLASGLMNRAPWQTRLSWTTAEATAAVRGEGKPARLSGFETGLQQGLERTDASALLIITDELLKSTDPAVEALIDRELRRASAFALDTEFFDLIIDGDTPTIASTGTGAADAALDILALLDAVDPDENSRLIFGLHPRAQRRAAFTADITGSPAFPDLTVSGGDIRGIPAMPVSALADGEVVLIDCFGLLGNAETAKLRSTEASIEMSDAPSQDGLAGTGSTMVNLWQNNLVGLMARIEFGTHRIRSNAVAKLTGAAWGGDIPVS